MKRLLPLLATSSLTLCALTAVRSVGVKYTMFLDDGTPLRAKSEIQILGDFPVPPMPAPTPSTGRRQYRPIVFRKDVDKSSRLLKRALANNEVLKEVVIEARRLGASGASKLEKTVTLHGVRVAAFRPPSPKSSYEEITFVFDKMKVVLAPSEGG